MQKLIVTFTNHPSALEEAIFDGNKIIEIYTDEFNYPDDVIDRLELEANKLREDGGVIVGVEVATESGKVLIRGNVTDTFNGSVFSLR